MFISVHKESVSQISSYSHTGLWTACAKNKNNTAHTGYRKGQNPSNNQCKRTTHIPFAFELSRFSM